MKGSEGTMWTTIQAFVALTRTRIQALRDDPEAGYATEFVTITALLALAAATALAILSDGIIAKVKSISF